MTTNTAPRRRGAPPAGFTASSEASNAPETSARAPLRGEMREEDPRERARKRAAEVRDHIGTMDEGVDEFSLPTAPDGWTYEWKRKTVLGAEDPAYQVHLKRVGWEEVPTKRHPEMMPGKNANEFIERKGMVLMERPTELVEEARSIELRRARAQVRSKEEQLTHAPDGQFGRDHAQGPSLLSKCFM
jgi:hypothetical protein